MCYDFIDKTARCFYSASQGFRSGRHLNEVMVVKLSELEITALIEMDCSAAGRQFIYEDDSVRDREVRAKLIDKGLAVVCEDGEYIEITDAGRDALAENE